MDKNIVINRDKLKTYHLKITALSPIHIGTGEAYNPTNFIIDNNKLYEFNEVLFYKSLDNQEKRKLNTSMDSWIDIIEFYKGKKTKAKEISYLELQISSEVQDKYNTRINKNGTRNQNQLEILKTFKNPNTHRAIIPGSSIKGMIDTVLGIYPEKIKENDMRQNLIVSDALLIDGKTTIGYMKRADRQQSNIINKNDGISQIVEVIAKDSSFICSIKTNKTFEDIQAKMAQYHKQRENSRYIQSENSFTARVGKYCGMEYVVDDINNAVQPEGERKPLGTHALFLFENKLEQFGWIKIELIGEDEYKSHLQSISKQEEEYFNNLENKQSFLKQKLQKEKEEEKAKKLKQEQDRLEEERQKAQKEAEENAKLEAMSPLERKIDELQKAEPNIPKLTIVFKAVEENKFEDKCEALQYLKQLMQEAKQWIEKSQKKNPSKDKNYQRTLKLKEMLEECY